MPILLVYNPYKELNQKLDMIVIDFQYYMDVYIKNPLILIVDNLRDVVPTQKKFYIKIK